VNNYPRKLALVLIRGSDKIYQEPWGAKWVEKAKTELAEEMELAMERISELDRAAKVIKDYENAQG